MTERRIRIEDVRAAGFCVRGAKAWFDRHGLNFKEFKDHGAEPETLLATEDALAVRVVERVRSRHG